MDTQQNSEFYLREFQKQGYASHALVEKISEQQRFDNQLIDHSIMPGMYLKDQAFVDRAIRSVNIERSAKSQGVYGSNGLPVPSLDKLFKLFGHSKEAIA